MMADWPNGRQEQEGRVGSASRAVLEDSGFFLVGGGG